MLGLILTRKPDTKTVCRLPAGHVVGPEGFELIVTVVEVRGDKVRLAFGAPDAMTIHREEVQDRIDDEFRKYGELP